MTPLVALLSVAVLQTQAPPDAGAPAPSERSLEARIESLERSRAHAAAELEKQLTGLRETLESVQAELETLSDEVNALREVEDERQTSRDERVELLQGAMAALAEADAVLERGSFDAAQPLARADTLLAQVMAAGSRSAAPRELDWTQAARDAISRATLALTRRDFLQARLSTLAAADITRQVEAIARGAPR